MSITTRGVAAISLVVTLAHLSGGAQSQPDLDGVGPLVGARVPDFSGVDQTGRTQTLQSILGPQGAMVVFFRSADW